MNDRAHPDQTLERWIADEDRLRATLSPLRFGVAEPRQIAGRSGLDMLQAIQRGELPAPPIGRTLDFWLVEASHGTAVFQGTPSFDHYNPLGTVHGGWISTLLDSAVGCSVQTMLGPDKAYTTIELKVNMVRAVTVGVPRLRAEGRVIHAGARIATAEGRLVGPDGRLYAHASTTCLIFDRKPAQGM
jgi:uncharacterized protein (TIGR00369 family)